MPQPSNNSLSDGDPGWEDALAEQDQGQEEDRVQEPKPDPEQVAVAAEGVENSVDKSVEESKTEEEISAPFSRIVDRPRVPEVPVSTIVGLMGLSSKSDVRTLETKIDSLGTKVTNLSNRLERITDQMMELFNDIDRTNSQFGDLKHFLKSILSSVVKDSDLGIDGAIDSMGSRKKSEAEENSADENSVNVISSE